MNPVPAQYKAPALPQVNLLPPEVGERRIKARRRGVGVFFLIVFLLIIAAVYTGVLFLKNVAVAEADLESERTSQLQAQIAEYSVVDTVKARLNNAHSARQYAAAQEYFWPLLMAALEAGMPDEVQIEEYVFTPTPFGQSPPPSASLFARSPVATISFTGRITNPELSAAIENELNSVPFFERARVTAVAWEDPESGEGGEGVATTVWLIEGTIDVTYDAMMLRYSPWWFGEEGAESLEAYYREFADAIIEGREIPLDYPPLPVATPPVFIPGQGGVVAPAPAPAPSEEAAE